MPVQSLVSICLKALQTKFDNFHGYDLFAVSDRLVRDGPERAGNLNIKIIPDNPVNRQR